VEDAARPGPDDPIDGQVAVGLQPPHGGGRQGSEPTVDAGGADGVPALYEGALQGQDLDARVAAHAVALPEERVLSLGRGGGARRGHDDQRRRQQGAQDGGPNPYSGGDRRQMRHCQSHATGAPRPSIRARNHA
jgi:hypothetical protein